MPVINIICLLSLFFFICKNFLNENDREQAVFIDEAKALHPLHIKPDGQQVPETFPFGM